MNTIYYTITEGGKFRVLKKCNEYEAFEPITVCGKLLERKTLVGLSNLLAKHITGAFCFKEVR